MRGTARAARESITNYNAARAAPSRRAVVAARCGVTSPWECRFTSSTEDSRREIAWFLHEMMRPQGALDTMSRATPLKRSAE
ncbi:hypothetical protein EVAR_79630_1 [Eumeta japonica]|uniref:Uncharacterized protein n=1 Tax=Eumeta variegata TaxID=151549 RepID=A0A4C1UE78_EUMVA|nr:hypothetical protein EVAR_79630_1 [Eumeta japonica]